MSEKDIKDDSSNQNDTTETEQPRSRIDGDDAAEMPETIEETVPEEAQQPVVVKSSGGKFATVLGLAALGVGGYSLYLQKAADFGLPGGNNLVQQLQENPEGLQRIEAMEAKFAGLDEKIAAATASSATAADGQSSEALQALRQQLQDELSAFNSRLDDVATTAASIPEAQSFAGVDESVMAQITVLSNANQALEQRLESLSAQQQLFLNDTIAQSDDADNSVWQLREAELLVSHAVSRLQNINDAPASTLALNRALDIITETGRGDMVPVANQLTQDIKKLEALSVLDVRELSARLHTLASEAEQLPLQGEVEAEDIDARKETDIEAAGAGLLNRLAQSYNIKKDGKPIKPVFSQELKALSQQKIQLTLETAQLALLNGHYDVFRNRLENTKNWVENYFDTEDQSVQNWIVSITQLIQSVPDVELPDISQSLSALRLVTKAGG